MRLAAFLLGDPAAEDVAQEAFIRLDRRHLDDRDQYAQVAYLRKIVVNLCRSALRRRLIAARHLPPAGPGSMGADEPAMAAFERGRLAVTLRRLPRRQEEALVLRYWGELSLAEIAAAMGVSLGTAKSTLSKAAGRFAAEMVETAQREGM